MHFPTEAFISGCTIFFTKHFLNMYHAPHYPLTLGIKKPSADLDIMGLAFFSAIAACNSEHAFVG